MDNNAYRYQLGYLDGLEYGHKNPQRSFDRKDPSATSYFAGLDAGIAIAQRDGTLRLCLVKWDTCTFDGPMCGAHATHLDFFSFGGHVLSLCERHAAQAATIPSHNVYPKGWF
jgi:hypothetical protein